MDWGDRRQRLAIAEVHQAMLELEYDAEPLAGKGEIAVILTYKQARALVMREQQRIREDALQRFVEDLATEEGTDERHEIARRIVNEWSSRLLEEGWCDKIRPVLSPEELKRYFYVKDFPQL